MVLRRPYLLVALLSVALIAGCGKARKEFERQLEICSVGENNGVLPAASDACGSALDIARQQEFPPDEISDLSYRLGRIERMQGHFEEAEVLLQASLDYESQVNDPAGMASRLVELAISLAGQSRWEEGTSLLERAAPSVRSLEGGEREAAINTLRGYAAQLAKLGDTEAAARFTELVVELSSPVSGNTAAQ